MKSVVTLLTDFGWGDPYLAELKAALYEQWQSIPELVTTPTIVDLCHTIPAGDIAAGGWFLSRVLHSFGAGTVHLAVVDPGVGTERPVVAVHARRQYLVWPGNGLLAFLTDAPDLAVVRLDNPLYHRQRGGRGPAPTFHGRDIMAPAAAHLAVGCPLDQVGSRGNVTDLGRPPQVPVVALGRVVWIDRFGNAITDIRRDGPVGQAVTQGACLLIGQIAVQGPYPTYGCAPTDAPFWYWGSGDCLEVALPRGDAAARYGWRRGLAIHRADP